MVVLVCQISERVTFESLDKHGSAFLPNGTRWAGNTVGSLLNGSNKTLIFSISPVRKLFSLLKTLKRQAETITFLQIHSYCQHL